MRKRFKGGLGVIGFLIIIVVLLGVFYFVYKKYFVSTKEIKIVDNLSINYENGTKFKVKGNKEIKFSVINNSLEKQYYYIEFKNLKDVKDVSYELTNNNDITINDTLNNYNTVVSSYILINGNAKEDFVLNIESNQSSSFSFEINVECEKLSSNTFAEVLLKNNEIKDNSLTTLGLEIATKDEGLIKTTDNYGIAYYFRGNVKNNYVNINGLTFRILKINGDGTVSLVLDDTLDTPKKMYDSIEDYSFASSSLKTDLENWAISELGEYEKFLTAFKYCNDITLDGNTFTAFTRVKTNNIPSLVCIGNRVSSRVGMLSVDDVIYAGAMIGKENNSFYLYNSKIENETFLLTGATINSEIFYPFVMSRYGKITYQTSGNYLRGIRPVITIIKTASTTGNGTVKEPYKLTL